MTALGVYDYLEHEQILHLCSCRKGSSILEKSSLEKAAPRCGQNEKDHDERKDEPMKLMTNTQVSVDGVVQGNGGPEEEDLRRGFERGGWARPLFDNEALA